jgi:hypothetical protein
MALLAQTGLTAEDLASRLSMDIEDDSDGLVLALEGASSDIEQLVQVFLDTDVIPTGLKVAILDTAATRYERTNLSTSERIGAVQNDYSDEYGQMMLRIAPWRNWAGL